MKTQIYDTESLPQSIRDFVSCISKQVNRAWESGDWKMVYYKIEKDQIMGEPKTEDDSEILVKIESAEVGFVFNEKGDFLGIYNWKE